MATPPKKLFSLSDNSRGVHLGKHSVSLSSIYAGIVDIEPLILPGICDIRERDPFMSNVFGRILQMICPTFSKFNLTICMATFQFV